MGKITSPSARGKLSVIAAVMVVGMMTVLAFAPQPVEASSRSTSLGTVQTIGSGTADQLMGLKVSMNGTGQKGIAVWGDGYLTTGGVHQQINVRARLFHDGAWRESTIIGTSDYVSECYVHMFDDGNAVVVWRKAVYGDDPIWPLSDGLFSSEYKGGSWVAPVALGSDLAEFTMIGTGPSSLKAIYFVVDAMGGALPFMINYTEAGGWTAPYSVDVPGPYPFVHSYSPNLRIRWGGWSLHSGSGDNLTIFYILGSDTDSWLCMSTWHDGTWSTGERVSNSTEYVDDFSAAATADGSFYVIYNSVSSGTVYGPTSYLRARTYSGGAWGDIIELSNYGSKIGVSAANGGNAVFCWMNYWGDYARTLVGGIWSGTLNLTGPNMPYYDIACGIEAGGKALVAYWQMSITTNPIHAEVALMAREFSGGSWGSVVALTERYNQTSAADYLNFTSTDGVKIYVSPHGAGFIVWDKFSAINHGYELSALRFPDQSGLFPGVPLSPSVSPTNEGVHVSWNTPSLGGGWVVNYTVYYRQGSGALIAINAGLYKSVDINGLTNGHEYQVAISAWNATGEGPMTAIMHATPRTVCSIPLGLQAHAGNGKVDLTWSAPSSNGGASVDYYLIYADGVLKGNTSALSGSVTELSNGQNYSFTVKAHNAAGLSAASAAVGMTPVGSGSGGSGDLLGGNGTILIVAIIAVVVIIIAVVAVMALKGGKR